MQKEKMQFWVYKNIEDRLKYIWESYKQTIDLYYRDIYELHNEYFRLYKGIKFIYVPIEFDDLLGIAFVMKGTYEELIIEKREIPSDFYSSSIGRKQEQIINHIREEIGISESSLYFNEPLPLSDLTTLRFDSSDRSTGHSIANLEYENFKKQRNETIGYQSTSSFISTPDLPVSISKYQPLLDKVKDEEFSFELNQAFQCFKNELFLPSALVVGRLIETALKILIIKKLGEEAYFDIQSKDRTISTFINKLEKNKIITNAEKNSISAAAMIRNAVSHSTGITDFKSNIHIMFSALVNICEKI